MKTVIKNSAAKSLPSTKNDRGILSGKSKIENQKSKNLQ
jgi:hypothetical protein